MKVLLYNWVQFDDKQGRSGGVRRYQANLVPELLRRGHTVITLDGGTNHDPIDRNPRIVGLKPQRERLAQYSLTNSAVLAPGHHAFGSPSVLEDTTTSAVVADFFREQAPDVIQLDSLEGLPLGSLAAAKKSGARVLLYAHNYYAVCPQVNLWRYEREHCDDFREGSACVGCIGDTRLDRTLRLASQLEHSLGVIGIEPESRAYRAVFRTASAAKPIYWSARRLRSSIASGVKDADRERTVRLRDPAFLEHAAAFKHRRNTAVEHINQHVDTVLATSDRVRTVLSDRGIDSTKITTCYIGTAHASRSDNFERRRVARTPGELHIAYLGYMRADKGFPFLLRALESAVPEQVLSRIRLTVAAPIDDKYLADLRRLAQRMVEIELHNGYSQDELPELLKSVDAGVVPVMWEDNLPQVAIEFVSHGLPIITSDRGGAQELGNTNHRFVFKSGDSFDFASRLCNLVEGHTSLADYWSSARTMTTMTAHVEELESHYQGEPAVDL